MIQLNPELVRSWSLELMQEEPLEYPFQATYQIEGKTLRYLAALHSCDPHSDTFTMIRNVLENQDVNFVLVEGIPYSAGVSPGPKIDWAIKQYKSGIYDGFETAFSISLAAQRNIPFVGGEPDDSFILSRIVDKGYSAEDLIFYYFLQQILQSQESKVQMTKSLADSFDHFLQSKNKFFNLKNLPKYSDFEKWCLEKNGEVFNPSQITAEMLAPFGDGKLYAQQISSAVCKVRDQFVVTKIGEALSRYDSVLVIYGGSHWSTQKRVFEKSLGSPQFCNLFNT